MVLLWSSQHPASFRHEPHVLMPAQSSLMAVVVSPVATADVYASTLVCQALWHVFTSSSLQPHPWSSAAEPASSARRAAEAALILSSAARGRSLKCARVLGRLLDPKS